MQSINNHFECERCLEVFKCKQNLQRHVSRQFLCEKIFRCKECDIDFRHTGHLNQHLKSAKHIIVTPIIPTTGTTTTACNIVYDNHGTVNQTVNNINITIIEHGNEDYKKIVNIDNLITVIKLHVNKVEIILHILRIVNFNPKYPENHNIYVSNKRSKDVNFKGENEWESRSSEFSTEIIVDILDFLDPIFQNNRNLFPFDTQNKFQKILNFKDRVDDTLNTDKTFKSFKKEVLNYLYHNRKMVMDLITTTPDALKSS